METTESLYATYIKSELLNSYDCLILLYVIHALAVSAKQENEKMKTVKVGGENNRHGVFMYAISTCAWCKRAKKFLEDNKIEHEYVDIDLCSREDREKIRSDILRRGGRLSYPTIIVDDKIMITGFLEHEIRETLEI